MGGSQTLLSVGSIILVSIITISLGKMYVQSVENSVHAQYSQDAINYGRDLCEQVQAYAFNYDDLYDHFGDLNDVTDPGSRLTFTSQVGRTLHAVFQVSGEETFDFGQTGRRVEIIVYEESGDEFIQRVEYATAVVDLTNGS